MCRNLLVLLSIAFACIQVAISAKDLDLYCGTCKAIVSEIEHGVGQVDPKKKIDVGSFRVAPDGKTRTVQKSYARSETHLTELLENVCNEVSENYVESKDANTGKMQLKRMVTHDGKMSGDVDFQQLMEDSKNQDAKTPPDTKTKKVKFACESIIEDYEDDFLHHFKKDSPEIAMKICADAAELCSSTEKDEL
uniref:Protein canopy homolog 2-like n=1 Tax=Phallusia mammillata TaxID=59560 RepID=A0A6F9D8Z4_9ASCI|nr:protein canopy homolog 2-like [Phallusia mammillata]